MPVDPAVMNQFDRRSAATTYHLKLTAHRELQTHPLTDLFVGTQTLLVREARGEASQHMVVANVRFAWIVDFERVGQYWLASSERFDAAANALLVHANLSAKIDATNFVTPAELPTTCFPDARAGSHYTGEAQLGKAATRPW